MNINGYDKNNFYIIDIAGKINKLKDSVTLKSFMKNLFAKKKYNIAFNISQVTYLDSGALNVLIFCHNVLSQKNGKLVLIAPNEYIRDVIEVVGLDKLVKIYSTKKEFENDKTIS